MSTIDAKLRLTAQFDQALAAIGQLRESIGAVSSDLRNAGGGAAGQALTHGLQGAAKQAEATTAQTNALEASMDRVAAGAQQAQSILARMAQQGGLAVKAVSVEAKGFADQVRAAATAADGAGEGAGNASRKGAKGVKEAGDQAVKSLQLTQRQLAQLSPQITDVFVSLAGGQSPLMVLIQQGGQIKDVFGGFGPAFRALATLVTPVTAVAAAVALLASGAAVGYAESDKLKKSLALTGVAAATSAGQIQQWASQMHTAGQASRAASLEALQAASASGVFQGETIKAVADAAAAMAKVSGKAADEWVGDFATMGQGVAAWATKANRSYAFLTVEQFKQIRALESQGRTQEAMRLAMEQLNGTITQRSVPAIGSLERGWNAVARAVKGVWEEMKSLGRDTSVDDQVKALEQQALAYTRSRDGFRNQLRGAPSEFQARRLRELDDMIGNVESKLAPLRRQMNDDQRRDAERSGQAAAVQAELLEQERDYQSALAQVSEAGSRQLLAKQLSALDQQRQAVDLQQARGLLSQQAYNDSVTALEVQRLRAEQAALVRRRALAEQQTAGTPAEARQREAALQTLSTEMIEISSRIRQAQAQGRATTEQIELEGSRARAQEWMRVWMQASETIRSLSQRNAETAADALQDPFERATAQAEASVVDIRRQLTETERDLKLQIDLAVDEGTRNAMLEQLQELGRQGAIRLNEALRTARLDSLGQSFGGLSAGLTTALQDLDDQAARGAISVVEAERRKTEARTAALPSLRALLVAQQALATTAPEKSAVAAQIDELDKLRASANQAAGDLQSLARDEVGDLFSSIATGAERADKAFGNFLASIAKRMLDLISRKMGEALIESLFSSSSGGGSSANWLAQLGQVFASFFHTGGVVKAGAPGRAVNPMAFLAAPRYHSGGIAGLRPGEVPAVLMQGEEVLTEDDPRHIRNLGGAGTVIGNLDISVSVSGAQGDGGSLNEAGGRLVTMIKSVVNDWGLEQMRPGGILDGRR